MRIDEVQAKNDDELRKELEGSYVELMNLRFRWTTQQLSNVYEMKKVRKKIARILTVLRERELGIRR